MCVYSSMCVNIQCTSRDIHTFVYLALDPCKCYLMHASLWYGMLHSGMACVCFSNFTQSCNKLWIPNFFLFLCCMPDEARDGRNVALKWQLEVKSQLLACLIVQNNHPSINSSMPNNFHAKLWIRGLFRYLGCGWYSVVCAARWLKIVFWTVLPPTLDLFSLLVRSKGGKTVRNMIFSQVPSQRVEYLIKRHLYLW